MNNIPEILIFIFSGIFYGSQFVPRKFCREISDILYNFPMTIGIMICSSILFIIFSLPKKPEFYLLAFFICLISGFIWNIGNSFLIRGVTSIGIARSFIFLNLVSVFSFFGGVLFLYELKDITIMVNKLFGMLIIILGCVFCIKTMTSEKNIKSSKTGVCSVIISTLFFSICNILFIYAIKTYNMEITSSVFYLSIGAILCSVFILIKNKKSEILRINRINKYYAYGIVSGILWCCGSELGFFGMKTIGISVGVPVIQGIMTIVSTLLGLLAFKEFSQIQKEKRKNAILFFCIGTILTILGVWLISIF